MIHNVTHDLGLVYWGCTQSCIMRNGDVVFSCKTSYDSPAEFHVYNTHGQKIKTIKSFCQHEFNLLLSLLINNVEYLTVSCPDCQKIYLYNIDTATITEAWHNPRYRVGAMCHGPQGTVCAVDTMKGVAVLILDCSTSHFHLKNTVTTNMEEYYDIYYIPTVDVIVISTWGSAIIRAVSLTSQILWELTGSVDDAVCEPHGLVYSQRHDSLLAADGKNRRILVLQPQSGQCLQTIDLSQHVASAWEPHLYEDQLILSHETKVKPKLSYYTVSIKYIKIILKR